MGTKSTCTSSYRKSPLRVRTHFRSSPRGVNESIIAAKTETLTTGERRITFNSWRGFLHEVPYRLTRAIRDRLILSVIAMTSKRILIADDSNTARGVLAKFFAQRDFDVCEAVDGEDTIEKARKFKPDLILLDVAMPHTNGIVAASVLKEMLPNVRIVLFTMYTEAIARAFPDEGLAVDAVISKGDGMGKLEECIQGLLRS
jgi:CheY-like chemotaxis protein